MSESDTPETDAVALDKSEGVKHPDLCETYMAWTDYWALLNHARTLERRLRELERPGVWMPDESTKEMMEIWHRAYEKAQWNADSWESAFNVAYKAILDHIRTTSGGAK